MKKAKEELVKEEILVQAQALFKQFGLKKTTMDDIASACGKAKSTLYHYYKSKEEVFDEVIKKEMTSLRRAVKEKVEKESALKDKILTYFVSFYNEVCNRMNLYSVVKQEVKIQTIGQLHFEKIINFEQEYISRILTDGYDSGEFTEFSKEDIPWLAKTLVAAFMGIVRFVIETEKGIDESKLKQAATMIIPRIFA